MIRKENIDNLDFVNIKKFCSLKDTVKRMNKQFTKQEKISVNHMPDKRLVFRVYKVYSVSKQTTQ